MTRIVKAIATLSVAGAALGSPALASAADFYVDQEAGDDTNSCAGPGNDACEHIQAAVNKAGTDDTIHVADPDTPTTYSEQVSLTHGKSLVSDSPDNTENVLEGHAGSAVDVFGMPGGVSTIQGFTIRGHSFASLLATHPVAVKDNVFDEPGPISSGSSSEVALSGLAGNSVVSANTFVDSNPVGGQPQEGIAVSGPGVPEISDNSFADLTVSIDLTAGTGQPVISGNAIKGTFPGAGTAAGIRVLDGTPAIEDNKISSPSPAQPGQIILGVTVSGFASPTAGASFKRNTILGMTRGLTVEQVTGAVSLNGDVIANSTQYGLYLGDFGVDDSDVSNVTATNVTIAGNNAGGAGYSEAEMFQAHLGLDSSIIGAAGAHAGLGGRCTITSSRGPGIGSAADGCDSFQTTADPMFVNPAAGDYHLASGSTMIDAGNPVPPAAGETDLDGDSRGLSGTACPLAAGTRDMGADEFALNCPPPAGGSGGSGGSSSAGTPAAQPSTPVASAAAKCTKKSKRRSGKSRRCTKRRKHR